MVMLSHSAAGWTIRPHTRDDAPEIERVFRGCLAEFPWRRTREPQEIERLHYLLRTSTVLVAEEADAGIVGFVILQAESAYISHLFVDMDWRFCGIGTGLLQVSRSIACNRLRLDVDVNNHEAQAAYERLGWQETVDQGRPGVGQLRMISP